MLGYDDVFVIIKICSSLATCQELSILKERQNLMFQGVDSPKKNTGTEQYVCKLSSETMQCVHMRCKYKAEVGDRVGTTRTALARSGIAFSKEECQL